VKKKVLLISVRSDIGGGPQHLSDLLKYSDNSLFNFYVASPLNAPFGSIFQKNSYGFIDLPHRKFSPVAFIRLFWFLKKNKIETIHSHGRGAGIYSRLLKLSGARVIHTFHGVHLPLSLRDRFGVCIEKILSHFTDIFLFVSESEKSHAATIGIKTGSRARVIANGILLGDLNAKPIPDRPFRNIGILSRFDPHKNVLKAIQLFATLSKKFPKLRLNIAGEGQERKILRDEVQRLGIEDKTTFHGFINYPLKFLAEQDMYLSTSLGEGLPYTVLESMKVNTIPILSNVSGHRDVLEPPYLFNLDDDKDFLSKFERLQAGIKHNFRVTLEERFEIQKQIKKVMSIYDEN